MRILSVAFGFFATSAAAQDATLATPTRSFFAASTAAQETVVSTPTHLRDLKGMGMSSMGMSSMGMSSMGMSSMGMSSMGMSSMGMSSMGMSSMGMSSMGMSSSSSSSTPTPTPNDDAIAGTAQADTTSYQCGACYEITLTSGTSGKYITRKQKVKVVDLTGTATFEVAGFGPPGLPPPKGSYAWSTLCPFCSDTAPNYCNVAEEPNFFNGAYCSKIPITYKEVDCA
ncbi:hypothetical protein TeGR_g9917 [Tetraparma gracilis]|uniref:Uncharacterized protein n=1 Tax=Tetraparma gracilis TaxID=2962635 RepID=A0ABQ6M5P8_9STRA|nr:hypothetical protein TeGR_g9917 [Tetraparma gracilis]